MPEIEHEPREPAPKTDWLEVFLYLLFGIGLTYFFFEPISTGVSGYLQSLW